MTNIISKNTLYQYSKVTSYFSADDSLKNLNESSRRNYSTKTIFLSHKHNELKELESVIRLLKELGVDIYVDWMDSEMPKTTSGFTAKRIKQKIKDSNKFILLATEGAITSKWCNWELGIGDVHKYLSNIAIFPIKDNYSAYSGSEYLDIYPSIQLEYDTYYVVNPDKTKKTLTNWLRS